MQRREYSQETSQKRSQEVQPSGVVDDEPIVRETHEKEGSTALT